MQRQGKKENKVDKKWKLIKFFLPENGPGFRIHFWRKKSSNPEFLKSSFFE